MEGSVLQACAHGADRGVNAKSTSFRSRLDTLQSPVATFSVNSVAEFGVWISTQNSFAFTQKLYSVP